MRTKVPKAYTRANPRKLVSQVLKTRKRREAGTFRNLVPLTLLGTTAGVSMNGMMTGNLFDGMKVGNKHMTLSASSFSLGGVEC